MSRAQPSLAVPSRPRLADHVAARRHVVDGVEWIVLHDTLQERTARIGPREWALLRSADGTRDLDGILAAAAARNRHARVEHLESFLGELQAAGMLASGPATVTGSSSAGRALDGTPCIEKGPSHRLDAPLDPLPGYRLDCDGAGSCCRIYPTTMFAPQESVRARALCPAVVDEGWAEERVFTPERGGSFWDGPGRPGARSVVMVDGRCGYLTSESGCALHQAAGAESKPLGCQLYPAVFVDDGEAIRVSVAPECACVFRSVGREGGAEIAPAGARLGADLDPRVFVRVLPKRIVLSGEREVERGRYVPWARSFAEYWRARVSSRWTTAVSHERADESGSDPARALWSTADAIDGEGLEWAATSQALDEPPPWPDQELSRWGTALQQRLRRRREEDALWRGEQDWARAASGWVLAAVERMLGARRSWPAFARDPAEQQVELFYLWALAHGHGMVQALPLSAALRDHALRLLVARAVGELGEALAPAAIGPSARSVPLALVEALLRGHGLQRYAWSLGWGLDPEALVP